MTDNAKSLRNVALFRDLPDEALASVERRCAWRTHQPSERILDHQDDTCDVHFLISGQAQVIVYSASGRAVTFREMGPGDIFGEFAAIDGKPRSASIEAITPCFVASMSPRNFQDALAHDARVALALIRHLVAQMRLLTDRIYEFSTLAVNNRLHAELLRLARKAPVAGNQVCINPAPTHSSIASRIATHREAVSREMSRLAQIGLLKRQGHALHITDVERLVRMVREAFGE